MLNLIKIAGIKLTDAINAVHPPPFDEFERPVNPKYPESLAQKERKFSSALVANSLAPVFQLFGGEVYSYKVPTSSQETLDIGDQALWHGITAAMFAFQYGTMPTDYTHELLRRCMLGLKRHQTGHGERRRRLIRGVRPDGTWQDDVSNDQCSGHLAGIYFAWKYGDAEIRLMAEDLIRGLAWELLQNDYALIGADNRPTTYGALIQGWKTDPLRASLAIAIFAVANEITCESVYHWHLCNLLDRYGPLIEYPKVKLLWWDTEYDTHRAAIHLSILADLLPDDFNERCVNGLSRIWHMVRRSGNTWVAFLVRRHIALPSYDVERAKKHLLEYALEDYMPIVERVNSDDPAIKKTIWNGKWRPRQPIERWRVPSVDFPWQRSLYDLDGYIGQKTPGGYHSPVGFLAAYWLGRVVGDIAADE